MKRIVFVIGQLGFGGGEKQLYLLLQNLDKGKFAPMVVSLNPGGGDYWESRIVALDIPVRHIKRNRFSLLRIIELGKILIGSRAHVIVCWSLYLNFVCGFVGRLTGKTVVASIRCDLFNETTPKIRLHRFLGTKLANRYVVNSTAGRNDMITKLRMQPERIKVIFNAIDSADTLAYPRNVRQQFLISEDKFALVNIGRFESGKNQLMLLRVLLNLKNKGASNVVVCFIGKGTDEGKLRAFVDVNNLSNEVFFLGTLPNAFLYLNAFDILCHCSVGEGMPNALAEAGFMGLPVISTEVNGVSDLIRHGETGYRVEQDDDVAMTKYIWRLYQNDVVRTNMGRTAKEHIRSYKFSLPKMVSDFEELMS